MAREREDGKRGRRESLPRGIASAAAGRRKEVAVRQVGSGTKLRRRRRVWELGFARLKAVVAQVDGAKGHGGAIYGAAEALLCVPRRHGEAVWPGRTRARVRLDRGSRKAPTGGARLSAAERERERGDEAG
jgi:hypothetical protein